MKFTLTYQGALPPSGRPPIKFQIRRSLSPQVKALWEREEFARSRAEGNESNRQSTTVSGRVYRPLIIRNRHVEIDLSVLLLRRDHPASLVFSGGDIDNRIKTLFDALQPPQSVQESGEVDARDGDDRQDLFTLVEDDRIITGLAVQSERWLSPGDPEEVLVVLGVSLKITKATYENLALLG